VDQQPAATVLPPSGHQQNSHTAQMNVNVSVHSAKPDASVNCHQTTAVISGQCTSVILLGYRIIFMEYLCCAVVTDF